MATTRATQAGTGKPAASHGLAKATHSVYGTVATSGAVAALGDRFVMCKLPKGAIIVGGEFMSGQLDSTGAATACMTINIGVNKAVVTPAGTTVTAASTSNCLAAAWALGSDAAALVGYKSETGHKRPLGALLLSNGPLRCTDDCDAEIIIVSSATGAQASTFMTLRIDYYTSVTG